MNFKEKLLTHKGLIICVIGAAATEDMLKDIKADIFISANEHGAKLTPVDYVVAMDDVHTRDRDSMRERIRQYTEAPIIGPFPEINDIVLQTWPGAPQRVYTGTVAVWVAWAMGAAVVVTVGMDCYYQDDTEEYNTSCFDRFKNVSEIVKCEVRVGDPFDRNPLLQIWPAYDPKEFTKKSLKDFTPHPSIEAMLEQPGEIQVRVRKPTFLQGQNVHRNQILTGQRHEFARALKHKMVEEYFGE